MTSEFRDYCGDLCDLLRTDSEHAVHLHEDPPSYNIHAPGDAPKPCTNHGAITANAYQDLIALRDQLKLLHGLNAPRTSIDSAASVNLSRAALADCFYRLAEQVERTLEDLDDNEAW